MMKTLRPYQQDCIDELKAKLKETTKPGCVVASVGAGKSLIIAELLLMMERANYRALCLTLNSDLIRQNVKTYRDQGGHASIYCAALKEKDASQPIVFASPHSIHKGIATDKNLKELRFNLIVIDECHNVNTNDKSSMYMRLLNHYGHLAQAEQYSFRVIGLTGTPFRGKGFDIVGDNAFFKYKVGNITTEWLISHGYLVDPVFGLPPKESYDFSNLKVMSTGQFSGKDLQREIDKQRLTGKLMQEVVDVVSKRNGAFIFASTIEHCKECLAALPPEVSAMITGETPSDERNIILNLARAGDIKYLVNVNVLTVGIDVPNFDTVVFVRPTESLVLYTQAIGRGLRLHDSKKDCLILDYAGNLERHGDLDHPIINKALTEWSNDEKEYCIPCFDCGTFNTMHARRCIGLINKQTNKTIKDEESKKEKDLRNYKRCDHFFEFKECYHCQAKNDKVSRHCWRCKKELIDPNANLSAAAATIEKTLFKVIKASYNLRNMGNNSNTMLFSVYYTAIFAEDEGKAVREQLRINETYTLTSDSAKNVFYHKFLKLHAENYTRSYLPLKDNDWDHFKTLIESDTLKTPYEIECVPKDGFWRVMKKHFSDEEIVPQTSERTVKVLGTRMNWVNSAAATIFGMKLEISYYCQDRTFNLFVVKDKYSITAQPLNRLLKDCPDLYKQLYLLKESKDKLLNFIGSWESRSYFKSPEKLVINPNGNIIKWVGTTEVREIHNALTLNEHLYKPGWKIIEILSTHQYHGDDFIACLAHPYTDDCKLVTVHARHQFGINELFNNHQIKEIEIMKESRYNFHLNKVVLINDKTINLYEFM